MGRLYVLYSDELHQDQLKTADISMIRLFDFIDNIRLRKKNIYFKYSEDEQFTGEYWIDGKKIYCQTVNFGQLPNNTIKTIEHGISNIDYVIRCNAVAKNSSNTVHFTLPYVNFYTSSASITFYFDNKYVSAHTGGNHNSLDKCYITFFYTKTTD